MNYPALAPTLAGMKRLLARFAICLLLLLPAVAIARPALWVVKGADTTIYLFGTVHLLPNDTAWHYPALDKAMADSQTLYIEVADDNPANNPTASSAAQCKSGEVERGTCSCAFRSRRKISMASSRTR